MAKLSCQSLKRWRSVDKRKDEIVLRRLAAELLLHLFRIWCGSNQLDLSTHRVDPPSLDAEFNIFLTVVIRHPRAQENQGAETLSSCYDVGHTRSVSVDDASGCSAKQLVVVSVHLDAKRPQCTPNRLCKHFLFVIRAFALLSMLMIVLPQGLKTLVLQWKAPVLGLFDFG